MIGYLFGITLGLLIFLFAPVIDAGNWLFYMELGFFIMLLFIFLGFKKEDEEAIKEKTK